MSTQQGPTSGSIHEYAILYGVATSDIARTHSACWLPVVLLTSACPLQSACRFGGAQRHVGMLVQRRRKLAQFVACGSAPLILLSHLLKIDSCPSPPCACWKADLARQKALPTRDLTTQPCRSPWDSALHVPKMGLRNTAWYFHR